MLRVAKVIPKTTAEGPHERLALWVAGCDLACPGCCNPELFAPEAGTSLDRSALARLIEDASDVEGITVLGGEPLQQPGGLAFVLRLARARGLGTIVFTGYTLGAAQRLPDFDEVDANVDTWVDGPFDARRPETRRRFIGSSNQRLHHRTSRYADATLWNGRTRVEVRIGPGGAVEAHGLPRGVARLRRALHRT
ncbi:MAG: 4Fe-4S single cluster domain-containing protein [Nannocystaceae bacterium]|nr:radical SAM protein [bacterium]